jgi:uncharacterized protein (TIGR03437 family)
VAPPPITVSSLACAPTTLASGAASTCTVTLSAATTAATSVAVSDNSAALTVPASVTVPSGSATATFTATAGTVTTSQTAIVTAALNGSSKTSSISLTSPTLTVSSLACAPATLASGAASTCTVTLSAATTAATSVAVSDNSAALTVPASVTVPSGSATATFTATAGTVTTSQTAIVTAALNGSSKTSSISLTSPTLTVSSLACAPTTLASGAASTCTVTLSATTTAATSVAVSDNSPALTVPASVTVPSGSATATFAATAGTITTNQTAVVTAALNGSSKTSSISLTAPPPTLTISSLACAPTTLASGAASTCTVTLSAAPTAATAVAVSDNSPALTVPSSVTVPSGSATATFAATAGTITTSQTAIVTATLNGSSKTSSISLTVPTTLTVSSLACAPTTLASGAASTCTVTLSAATTAATSVAVSDNSPALTVPSSVTVPSGSASATFAATAGTIATDQAAIVTAALNGSSKTSSISLTAPSGTAYSLWSSSAKPNTVSDPDTQTVELGMKFRSSQPGSVTGVRFYKGSQNGGTHVGHLWSNTGTLLASVTFTGETASGWQLATFASPVTISANTTYVISYQAPSGHYADDTGYFSSALTNGPLTALKNGQDGSNGVYRYGKNLFPNATWQSSNYWVDVVFKPTTAGTASMTATANLRTGALISTPSATGDNSSLACSPRTVPAGSSFLCELEVNDASGPVDLTVDRSNIALPSAVKPRAGQHTLSIRGSVNPGAAQQPVTIAATRGGNRVEDTITMMASAAPVINVPPDQLIRSGLPVAFKVSVDSVDPVVLSAASLPAGASFDPNGLFQWTPVDGQQRSYDLKFTAKGLTAASTTTVHVEVGDGMPSIASPSEAICSSGAIASLSGKWLGPDDAAADPSGNSTELGGTAVRVNGSRVPLLYAGKTQASFLCPAGTPGDALKIELETPSGVSTAVKTTAQAATPFLLSVENSNQGLIFFADTTQLATVRDIRGAGQPAQPGDSLSIRATGLGTDLPVSVKIGDADAKVLSIAPAGDAAGVWNIRVTVPSTPNFGGAVPVKLEMASQEGRHITSNSVIVAIEPARN